MAKPYHELSLSTFPLSLPLPFSSTFGREFQGRGTTICGSDSLVGNLKGFCPWNPLGPRLCCCFVHYSDFCPFRIKTSPRPWPSQAVATSLKHQPNFSSYMFSEFLAKKYATYLNYLSLLPNRIRRHCKSIRTMVANNDWTCLEWSTEDAHPGVSRHGCQKSCNVRATTHGKTLRASNPETSNKGLGATVPLTQLSRYSAARSKLNSGFLIIDEYFRTCSWYSVPRLFFSAMPAPATKLEGPNKN